MQEKILIHTTNFVVRWGDMDGFGHVNNTVYFLYAQEARFALMHERNLHLNAHNISPILGATSCKFIRPIVYPETVTVETWFSHVNDKKAFFEHVIKSATKTDLIYAIIEATVIWFDFAANKSINIPEEVLIKFGIKFAAAT